MAPSLSASTAFTLLCACAVRSVAAANTALDVNPSNADAHITVQGSDFLWAIFAAMLASALGVTVWALFTPRKSENLAFSLHFSPDQPRTSY
jgi:bacteriorhodopsin